MQHLFGSNGESGDGESGSSGREGHGMSDALEATGGEATPAEAPEGGGAS
jgi:hypothetical protein